ncbi:hypothetical protein [Nocardia niwae]|uniref:hypothetical protein n=1 Tax=Nocardia niwae TaxID=626084 RepID=UPI003407F5DF
MDKRLDELASLIDPDAWRAREDDQETLGSAFQFKIRRMHSLDAARRILAAGYSKQDRRERSHPLDPTTSQAATTP